MQHEQSENDQFEPEMMKEEQKSNQWFIESDATGKYSPQSSDDEEACANSESQIKAYLSSDDEDDEPWTVVRGKRA